MEDGTGSLQRPYIFRDPVHGDIAFARDGLHTLVRQIVDDEGFQRLRSIKQNGVLDARFDVTRLLVLEDVRDHLRRDPPRA